jgi:Zn finger protein HypA/HybF involved in hydrogenase expression
MIKIMPQRLWKHNCPDNKSLLFMGTEICEQCGQKGIYIGWHYGMYERMSVYQRVTGLKPVGPHRPMAHKLLSPLLCHCVQCKGEGLINNAIEDDYDHCPECDGKGYYVPEGMYPEFQKLRLQILEIYPEAEATNA